MEGLGFSMKLHLFLLLHKVTDFSSKIIIQEEDSQLLPPFPISN